MKVAIIHDWLTGLGGQENVLEQLLEVFPEADIFTSVYIPEALPQFRDRTIYTSFLQKIPLAKKKHQLFAPLRQFAFERFDLSAYDLVISQTAAEAKSVKTRDDQPHICYINSEIRYYWSQYEDYKKNPGFGKLDPLVRIALPILVPLLRRRDLKAAARPDHYIANSNEIRRRVEKYYKRGAKVIFPPVDVDRFKRKKGDPQPGESFVISGRQVPYKRVDLAVAACTLAHVPLKVLGDGPDHQKLKAMAGPTITFMPGLSNEDFAREVKSSKAFIFPNLEDFGIVPVEAMAAGLPVIAYRAGGALDTVVEGLSGEFFDEQTPEALAEVIKGFDSSKYDPMKIVAHAKKFSNERFRKEIREFVANTVDV